MLSLNKNTIFDFADKLKTHILLFLFYYLSIAFTRYFISASMETHPYMAMWCALFFMATVSIILSLLYGQSNVGRDVNTLVFYIPILHLIYLPFYYYGYQFAIYHNTAVKFINALILLRLCYFGERELFSRIAFIERTKTIFQNNRWLFSYYVNGLTITLFFLCAMPLFTLIYIINTDEMRITGIAVVLFTFFIAIEVSDRRTKQSANNSPSISIVKEAEQDALNKLTNSSNFYKAIAQILGAALIAVILFSALSIRAKEVSYFKYGYNDGYTDGKNGKAPISDKNREKLLNCYRYDSNNIAKEIPDPDCGKIDRSGWR